MPNEARDVGLTRNRCDDSEQVRCRTAARQVGFYSLVYDDLYALELRAGGSTEPIACFLLRLADVAQARPPPLGGMPFVHYPSTLIQNGGKYYVYTTGRGIPMLYSPDRVNWARLRSVFSKIPERVLAAVPKNSGTDAWAPDIIRVGNTSSTCGNG